MYVICLKASFYDYKNSLNLKKQSKKNMEIFYGFIYSLAIWLFCQLVIYLLLGTVILLLFLEHLIYHNGILLKYRGK